MLQSGKYNIVFCVRILNNMEIVQQKLALFDHTHCLIRVTHLNYSFAGMLNSCVVGQATNWIQMILPGCATQVFKVSYSAEL